MFLKRHTPDSDNLDKLGVEGGFLISALPTLSQVVTSQIYNELT